jgi:putative phosphoesterase
MKLALMGDIHGNIQALRTVLDAVTRENIEKLLITGDLVGYYFSPLEVVELLGEWDVEIVRGNHEEMLKTALKDPNYLLSVDARYGTGLRVAFEQLSSEQIERLCELDHPLHLSFDGVKILLCHGSPWDFDQYIYPNAEKALLTKCAISEYDLVVMGHTHYPMQLMIGSTLIVNPGSVGQPRNRYPGAHWAIFDTVSRSIEFRCESYDMTHLIRECRERNPNLPYLANVLERT